MSTSGTYTWTMTLQSLVNAALRKLAVLSGGSSPETYEVTNATEALNAMLVGLQTQGLPVWKMTQLSFTTVGGQHTYTIGAGQGIDSIMPLKVVQAWRSTNGQANIPVNVYTNYNYNLLPQITSSGTPVNLYYQPLEVYGQVHLWPTPQDTTNLITIRYQAQFSDMVNLTDEIDFPRYWYEAIIYGLASRLAPEYGIALQDRAVIEAQAERFKQDALSYGQEEGSMFFQPDWTGTGRAVQ